MQWTKADISRFKAQLEAMKNEIQESGFHKLEPNRTDDAGRRDDDHQPLNEMNQAISSARNRNSSEVLQRIEAALHKIATYPDEYGLCVDCEEPIPVGRLKLMRDAELCVPCQGSTENQGEPSTRRNLTDYV